MQEIACAQLSPSQHRKPAKQLTCADMSECSRRVVLLLEPPAATCLYQGAKCASCH